MKLAIIGGTGGTGIQILKQAVEAGHVVKALVRNRGKLQFEHPNLEIVDGDALDADAVSQTIAETDAVISAIGASGFGNTSIYSDSAEVMIDSMNRLDVHRIICIGAVGMEPEKSRNMPLIGRVVVRLVLKNVLADMLVMQRKLEASALDWTMMWPPQLSDADLTGNYRITMDEALRKGSTISRKDLAHCVVNNIGNEDFYKKRVAIAY